MPLCSSPFKGRVELWTSFSEVEILRKLDYHLEKVKYHHMVLDGSRYEAIVPIKKGLQL